MLGEPTFVALKTRKTRALPRENAVGADVLSS